MFEHFTPKMNEIITCLWKAQYCHKTAIKPKQKVPLEFCWKKRPFSLLKDWELWRAYWNDTKYTAKQKHLPGVSQSGWLILFISSQSNQTSKSNSQLWFFYFDDVSIKKYGTFKSNQILEANPSV